MKRSAGLLLYRPTPRLEVLIVHPGGPFWAKRDEGAWSIPKGEIDGGEDPLAAAQREFVEELGVACPPGPFTALGEVMQKAGKVVMAWAVEGDVDLDAVLSNTFEMEWPPRSGNMVQFPEIDRAEWVKPDVARQKLNSAQAAFVDRCIEEIGQS